MISMAYMAPAEQPYEGYKPNDINRLCVKKNEIELCNDINGLSESGREQLSLRRGVAWVANPLISLRNLTGWGGRNRNSEFHRESGAAALEPSRNPMLGTRQKREGNYWHATRLQPL